MTTNETLTKEKKMTTAPAINADPKTHYTRHLDDIGDFRNILIEVYPADEWMKENGITHIASSCHECWTGVQWLMLTNTQECYSFGEAIDCAKSMRSQLECG